MTLDDAEMQRRLLYCDDDVIILNKPSGIAVHKGTHTPDDLEAHFSALCFGQPHPPCLAHRLDKDTSGCLVLGRHAKALTRLGRLFAGHHVEKSYWAITAGCPAQAQGRIDLPLLKLAGPGGARMEVHPQGRSAVTDFRVVAVHGGLAWLELRPQTGRSHQLRAHCRALGTPILGDATYGQAGEQPLHLHARALRMTLHRSAAEIAVQAPLPAHMAATFAKAGFAIAMLDR